MTVVYILIAILMFGLLIAVHEFGHFITAKLLGVKVNEFAIGMGPRILHKKKGETEYTLRAFPIGGFCAMEGEEGEESADPRAFSNKPAWKRLIILAAGAFMNFVAGVVIFLLLFIGAESYYVETVDSFTDWSSLPASGLRVGDRFLKIDGHSILVAGDAKIFLDRARGSVDIEVLRGGERVLLEDVDMTRTPVTGEDGKVQNLLGVTLAHEEYHATLGDRLRLSWYNTIDTVRLVWVSLGDLVTGKVSLRDLSGVVYITAAIGDGATEAQQAAQSAGANGFLAAISQIAYMTAFIAINLAVMNLLPIPALDGGQIFFLLVDKVYGLFTKKRINPKYLGYINAAGLIALLLLMAVVAVSDVFKLFGR